jgi:hypothetical protein
MGVSEHQRMSRAEQRRRQASRILLLKTNGSHVDPKRQRGDQIMSGIVAVSAAAALTTVAAVVIATLPDAQALLSPLTDSGNEYVVAAVSIFASLPILAVMTVLAASGRE